MFCFGYFVGTKHRMLWYAIFFDNLAKMEHYIEKYFLDLIMAKAV